MNRLRRLAFFTALLVLVLPSFAAKEDPVQWSLAPANRAKVAPGGKILLALTATIQPGWHLYSPTTPLGGPIVTSLKVNDNPAIAGYQLHRPQPERKLDPNFNIDTETYEGEAKFLIEVETQKAATGKATVETLVRYQACSDTKCLTPVKKTSATEITFDGGAPAAPLAIPANYALVPAKAAASSVPPAGESAGAAASSQPQPVQPKPDQQGLLVFLLVAFGAGLAAIFTPCVFPMIPITISFFLNQSGSGDQQKAGGWKQAVVFCLGIVVLFTGLGFLAKSIAGPFGVVQLGSSPWVNGFISIVFFIFGLSLLGAFELRLPSGLLTKLDRASQGGGYGATLLMGLTFSLTSFACVGPIVGPLLVASVQSQGLQPVLGMASFATGLAAPFFLLALFPSFLKKLPRSGGWLARVKVVLGFVVLAAMLKYLSNIDQVLQTNLLTRERFLAGWIVLFSMAGLYLLGFLRLDGISKDDALSVPRVLVASALLIFSISLLPGLFGASLGELDAYIPDSSAKLVAGGGARGEPEPALKNQYEEALAMARRDNKLVLVNFTGYACTNCHWMKKNIFTRPEIRTALKDLIIVDLYTDGTDDASEKNQKLQESKFQTASIPFYAIVDADEKIIATFPQLTRNPQEFLAFLQTKSATKA